MKRYTVPRVAHCESGALGMERLKDPMVTPTAQYAGSTQGNQFAHTAPGSDNVLPVAPFNTPMDMQSSAGPLGHPPVSTNRDRTGGNPPAVDQLDAGGWMNTDARPGTGGWRNV